MAKILALVECDRLSDDDLLQWVRNADLYTMDGAAITITPYEDPKKRGEAVDAAASPGVRGLPRNRAVPSTWYTEATRDKFKGGRWAEIAAREWIEWWCWVFWTKFKDEQGQGVEDPTFRVPGAVKEVETIVRRAMEVTFATDPRDLHGFLWLTARWWEQRRARGESFPDGLPALRRLLERDTFLRMWQGGEMKQYLDAR